MRQYSGVAVADVNSTTWAGISKIAGAAEELGGIAEKGTVAGIVKAPLT
jgi:hypothetical protein